MRFVINTKVVDIMCIIIYFGCVWFVRFVIRRILAWQVQFVLCLGLRISNGLDFSCIVFDSFVIDNTWGESGISKPSKMNQNVTTVVHTNICFGLSMIKLSVCSGQSKDYNSCKRTQLLVFMVFQFCCQNKCQVSFDTKHI